MQFNVHGTIKGRTRWFVLDEENKPLEGGHWYDNLYTDVGLDHFASQNFQAIALRRYHCVGDGTLAHVVTDTTLQNELGRHDSDGGFTTSPVYTLDGGTNELVMTYTLTRVFTAAGALNIAEDGLSPFAGANAASTILMQVKDGGGTPITVSVPAGKKFRRDHTLEVRIPYFFTNANFDHLEYDLTTTLINTTSHNVDGTFYADSPSRYSVAFQAFNPTNALGHAGALFGAQNNGNSDITTSTGEASVLAIDGYTNGNYFLNKVFQLSESEGVGANTGWYFSAETFFNNRTRTGFKGVLTGAAISKSNTQLRTVRMRVSWGRAP